MTGIVERAVRWLGAACAVGVIVLLALCALILITSTMCRASGAAEGAASGAATGAVGHGGPALAKGELVPPYKTAAIRFPRRHKRGRGKGRGCGT